MIHFSDSPRSTVLHERRTRTTKLLPSIIVAAITLMTTVPARADAPGENPQAFSAENLATAREALREGMALRDSGDLTGALAKLHLAHTLVAIPVTAYELGKTHMAMGHLLSARELFLEVGRLPRSVEESERSETARRESVTLAAALEPRIPSLHLKITLPNGASAVVRVDGTLVQEEALDAPRRVNPGPHEVTAKAGDGPEQKVDVDVHEGETKDVALAPTWVPPKEAPPPPRPFYVKTSPNPLVFVGIGAATAGAIASTAGLIVAITAKSAGDSQCHQYCTPGSQGDFDREEDGFAVALMGAGLVVAGVALLVYSVPHPRSEKIFTQLAPVIGPGALGLRGTF